MDRWKPGEVLWEIEDVQESEEWEEAMSIITQLGEQLQELLKTLKKGFDTLKGSTNLVNGRLQPLVQICFSSLYFLLFFICHACADSALTWV